LDADFSTVVPEYAGGMSALLGPLHGTIFIIFLVMRIVIIAALIDSLLHPEASYVANGKQTKWFWILVLVLGFFISLVGLIAAIVYFVDVRPAIKGSSGQGGSSSDGPYGPYRR
jgi:hypothetical protein